MGRVIMTRSRTETVCTAAIFVVLALILSYVEAMIPLELVIPIPGLKFGLANLAVAAAFFILGTFPALCVSLSRILLNFLLFGSVTSLWFSLSGGLLSFSVLVLWKFILKRYLGAVGLSVLCAAMHNLGQCAAAFVIFGGAAIRLWLPVLLVMAMFTGTATGVLLYFITERLQKNTRGI